MYPVVEQISRCLTLIDYVQFKTWKKTDCFSKDEHYQVSASYAMGILFNHWMKAPGSRGGGRNELKLIDIAPSFFRTGDKARRGCFNYGHGIVYEGCWVTFDDNIMCGSSKLELPGGKSINVLCKDEVFRTWFTKVLSGAYQEYDFDTLSLDILISLTSPNTPGSLASDNPAGSRPSAGLSTPDNQAAALARQRAPKIRLKIGFPPFKKAAAPIQQGADASTPLALTNSPASLTSGDKTKTAKLRADAGLSISNNDQAVADRVVTPSKSVSSLSHSSNKSIATVKEGKATPAQDGSQPAGHAAVKPLTATQPSDNPTTSNKRKNPSPLTSSLDKRAKTGPVYQQRKEVIDISSGDEEEEEKVKPDPDNPQSSSNATQNQKLMKEIASLKLSESRAVDRANEALEKIEKLTEENTNLKLAEMRAVNRANEALSKLRAANRANEELGGNEDLVGQIGELMRENASLKQSALRPADGTDGTMDKSKDIPHRIKSEGASQQIKKEKVAGQHKE
ncbi:hypothetical protein V496_00944 [Pseudogymnoascus sp. VKM F-4515 (FW-2607)]|nr:hypothetical protein V496_00944 [Pseudogymnoascus sp. VKM F-4515 (FW-2607)]KFY98601.1 hypothetical protein V498_01360 [Pseudogymnoascus sp. VKM F-4517 (FW-2822)]